MHTERDTVYKLENIKNHRNTKSFLYDTNNNIYKLAITRLKPYIDQNVIQENEIDTFIQIIEKNIIYNMFKNTAGLNVNILYLNELLERKKLLENQCKIRKC